MRIAVLSLQGAFIEHERMLRSLGADVFEVRELADWHQPKDGLVLPGGESTTQAKLLGDLNLLDPIRADIEAGLPVFGTCAGLILLAKDIEGRDVFLADSSYVLSMAEQDFEHIKFHFTSEF